jgi:AP-2 complex subunit beta-1
MLSHCMAILYRRYATEVDADFARKAVRSIGRLAVKIEDAARKCVAALLELVSTKVSYVVQEATVVSRDILRKYPGQYESIISTLCENLDSLDEPESKKSIIWVIGQYAARIENADTLLEDFIFSLADETYEVQLALLTATVKLFIARPAKGQELVLRVLTWATKEAENPDLRDRGFMYWRLLSTNLSATKQIVLSEKRIGLESENRFAMEEYIGSLASVYHKSPQQFIRGNFKPRILELSPALRTPIDSTGLETNSIRFAVWVAMH